LLTVRRATRWLAAQSAVHVAATRCALAANADPPRLSAGGALAVCPPSLTLPVTVRARSIGSRALARCWHCLLGDERRAPFDPLGRGSHTERPVRNGPVSTRSAFSRAPEAAKCFVRRPILPTRLSTQGEQFRAPRARVAPRHPSRRCLGSPRAGSPAAILFGSIEGRTQTRPAD
jgi:hypothetical protein